jgi:hypothetical protein
MGKPKGCVPEGSALWTPARGYHPLDRDCGHPIWQCQMECPKGALKGPARGFAAGGANFFN